MAELKQIDEDEKEPMRQRNLKFDYFPLKQFSDFGKVDKQGDPHLKAAAETELYEFEKHTSEDKFEDDSDTMEKTETKIQNKTVSHVYPVSETEELDTKAKVITTKCYGPVYIPIKTEGQNILIPQEADMSRKDNLKLLYGSQPLGTCMEEEHDCLKDKHYDTETFQYSHEASKKCKVYLHIRRIR